MDMDLTGRQREILNAIRDYMEQEGKPPTIRELGDMFGFASSTVFQHLGALERKGVIKRTGGASSRSIEIVGLAKREY